MFSLRNRFGIPGVISVIALVFAMMGGAYAASNSGTSGHATASAAKGPPGPRGPRGKTGKAGKTGPAGPTGPTGPAGANGKDGSNGSNGISPVGTSFNGAKEGHCTEGGVEFVGANKTFACNGVKGTNGTNGTDGAPGSPWTPNNTLPANATETGSWAWASESKNASYAPISFTVKLASSLASTNVHYSSEGTFATTCTGSAFNPTAPSGHLCVYQVTNGFGFAEFQEIEKSAGVGEKGATTTGALLKFLCTEPNEKESAVAYGTWAVTG